jgi:hypothetical protein
MASPDSARDNTVAPMRRVGSIDDDGALTERGNKRRVDASYSEACQEILDEVYPADLAALTDDSGAADPQAVKTWFDHKGFGDSTVTRMTGGERLIEIARSQNNDGWAAEAVRPPGTAVAPVAAARGGSGGFLSVAAASRTLR